MASLAPRPQGRDRPPTIIAPSLLSCDFGRLAEESKRMVELGADWLHVDVMVRAAGRLPATAVGAHWQLVVPPAELEHVLGRAAGNTGPSFPQPVP